jgi:tetratricopeptide (TPR) repeat protein
MRTTDVSSTLFAVILCLLMIIGGLEEGYHGLAVLGGMFLGLMAFGVLAGLLTKRLEKEGSPALIPLGVLVLVAAGILVWLGDAESIAMAALLVVLYAIAVVVQFALPDKVNATVSLNLPSVEGGSGGDVTSTVEQSGVVLRTSGDMTLQEGAQYIQGLFHAMRGDNVAAERAFRTMVAAPQGDCMAIMGNAALALRERRWADALESANKAVLLGGGPEAQLLRGQVKVAIGAASAGLEDIDAACSAGDTLPYGRQARAMALLDLARPEEALDALRDAPDPLGVSAHSLVLAEVCRRLGRDEEARSAFEDAAARLIGESARGTASNIGALPVVLIRLGNLDQARHLLAEQAAQAPDDPALLCAQATLAAEQGDLAAALEPLSRAATADPQLVVRTMEDASFTGFTQKAEFVAALEQALRRRNELKESVLRPPAPAPAP